MAEEKPKRPKKRKAGWFVEVDAELKEEFKRYYPGRSAMKKVTVLGIKRAIQFAKVSKTSTESQ